MYNYLFIINPRAGRFSTSKIGELIASHMEREGKTYKIVYTEKKKDATRLVIDNIDNYQVFVAVGGDGTIKEVAEGISISRRGILAVLPLGTGNDLAKVLYKTRELGKILNKITKNRISYIDTARVNKDYFFNIASLGYDAQVIVNYNKMEKFKGKFKYFLAVIYSLFNFKYREVSLKTEDFSYQGKITLLAIGNGKFYGGFFKVLPEAEIDDGYLHICLVKKISRIKIFFLAPFLIFGLHKPFKSYVVFLKAREVQVQSRDNFKLNLDGEIIEETSLARYFIGERIKIIY